jgi:hypothetical protein
MSLMEKRLFVAYSRHYVAIQPFRRRLLDKWS